VQRDTISACPVARYPGPAMAASAILTKTIWGLVFGAAALVITICVRIAWEWKRMTAISMNFLSWKGTAT